MKHNITIIIFFLSLSLKTKAQNLVYNGDFEIYSQCPANNLSQTNSQQIIYATGWFAVGGTPDYWNVCSNGTYNTFGYQRDCYSGGGYAGEYMICNANTSGDDLCREYIGTKLIDTLKSGHKYLSNMYVNRANFWNYSIATIGILFTDTVIILPNPNQGPLLLANPQIKNIIPLTDTLNWVLVQDTFIATGNEAYLTIGNFNTTATSDTVKSPGGFGTWVAFGSAYYYIDAVSVYDVTGGSCNNYWDAGFDKYIMANDSIRLGAINTDNSTYTWVNAIGGNTYLNSNTDARPWSTPSVTTTYYVTKTCPNNNVFIDTVTVHVQQHAGIKQNINNVEISVYPNPTKGNINVVCNFKGVVHLEISDINGNLVGSYILPEGSSHTEVKNNDLKNGVYFYRIMDANGVVLKIGKIVVMQ